MTKLTRPYESGNIERPAPETPILNPPQRQVKLQDWDGCATIVELPH
jgi:hypothetical protein